MSMVIQLDDLNAFLSEVLDSERRAGAHIQVPHESRDSDTGSPQCPVYGAQLLSGLQH